MVTEAWLPLPLSPSLSPIVDNNEQDWIKKCENAAQKKVNREK
jgi:hypothetical protein